MRKKIILLFLCIITFSGKQIAQSNSIKKDQRLIVITHVENEKYVGKLTKKKGPEKLNLYKHLVNDYDTYIKEAVSKYLNYFSNIEYKTETEVEAMNKEEMSKCYFLMHEVAESIGHGAEGMGWRSTSLEQVDLDSTNVNEFSKVELKSYNKKEKMFEPLITKNIYYLNFSKADIFYSVEQLNRDLSGIKTSRTKSEVLKSKTLILNKEMLEKDLTEAEIKSVYPYNFKIVDKTAFEAYRLSNDKTVLCLIIAPFMKTVIPIGMITKTSITYSHFIYDPSSGDNYIGILTSGAPGYTASNDKIKKKSFESYLKD